MFWKFKRDFPSQREMVADINMHVNFRVLSKESKVARKREIKGVTISFAESEDAR